MNIKDMSSAEIVDYLITDMEQVHDSIFAEGDAKTVLYPVVIAIAQSGSVIKLPIHQFMASDAGKALMAELMPRLLSDLQIDCYGMAAEAWMSTPSPGDKIISPSKSESRIEVIMTQVRHRDGLRRISCREIIRDYVTGKVSELRSHASLSEVLNQGEIKGQFSNLFKAPDRITYAELNGSVSY